MESGFVKRGWVDTLMTLCRAKYGHPETIRSYQSRQLRRILWHAAETVPYYHRLFETYRVDLSKFKGIENLTEIPITTKSDLMDQPFQDLISLKYRADRLIHYRTSGSTGQPMTICITPLEELILAIFRLRAYRRFGFRLPEKMARIRNPGLATGSRLARLLARLKIYQVLEISSQLSPDQVAREIRNINPDSLVTYPGNAHRVSKVLTRSDRDNFKLRWMAIGGSTIYPQIRQDVEEKFGIKPDELYASREAGIIAWECPVSGLLHVNDDAVIVEILQKDQPVGPGQKGEVVITALHSFAQPFIRFRLNDFVVKGPERCKCGLPYSSIRNIEGRVYHRMRLPNGATFSPSRIFKIIEDELDWIQQYQLRQEKLDLITLYLVLKQPYPKAEMRRFKSRCENLLGSEVQFQIKKVTEISPDRNGKYQVSITSFE